MVCLRPAAERLPFFTAPRRDGPDGIGSRLCHDAPLGRRRPNEAPRGITRGSKPFSLTPHEFASDNFGDAFVSPFRTTAICVRSY
ncbi:hypothetical protein SALBM311S_03791 [Streptomyces alboniger]